MQKEKESRQAKDSDSGISECKGRTEGGGDRPSAKKLAMPRIMPIHLIFRSPRVVFTHDVNKMAGCQSKHSLVLKFDKGLDQIERRVEVEQVAFCAHNGWELWKADLFHV